MLNTQLRNPYPAIDLRRAYDYLVKLRQTFQKKEVYERQELLQGLGFSERNGTGHNVVGALSHYGLLRKETSKNKTMYQITEAARNLLASEKEEARWRQLAYQIATYPVLFHFLASEYPDNKLPVGLDGRLIKKYPEVTQKNVGAILYRYKESLKFVDTGPQAGTFTTLRSDKLEMPGDHTSDLLDFPLPLSDGTLVTFSLPKALSKRDGDKITRYIQALTETLVEDTANH